MAFRLMILDDSSAMRTFIARIVDISGLDGNCLQATSGQEALDLLEKERVDIILTDINMPTMNGEEFVRRMQQHEQWRAIPILVVSTDGSENRIQRLMALGAKGYVKKPFSPELLRERIEQALGVASD